MTSNNPAQVLSALGGFLNATPDRGDASRAPLWKRVIDAIRHPTSVAMYQVALGAALWLCTMLLIAVPDVTNGLESLYPAMFSDTWTILVLLGADVCIIYFVVSDNSTYEVLSRKRMMGTVVFCLAAFALLGKFFLAHFRASMDARRDIVIAIAVLLLFVPRAISYWQPTREKLVKGRK